MGVRFLLTTRNFPPLLGGMEKLNRHLFDALDARGRAYLCGPDGSTAHLPEAAGASTAPVAPLWRFLVCNLWQTVRQARALRPHCVIAGSGLTAPAAWIAARLTGARAVVYVHGLDLVAPSAVYRRLWLPFIRDCDRIIANSENTRRLAEERGVAPSRLCVVPPGVALPSNRDVSRDEAGATPTLLSVGRLTRRKGLARFVREALPRIVARVPATRLVIVGSDAVAALHGSGGGRAEIETAARDSGMSPHVVFLGTVGEDELQALYASADCHVFPVIPLAGDVEGFGMVAVEAAAQGLPTVAFDEGGIAGAVCDGVNGRLVESGDYATLADAIVTLLQRTPDRVRADAVRAQAFAAGFSWTHFAQRVHACLDELR